MKFFEATGRASVQGREDVYEEKSVRLTEEARLLFQQGRLSDSEEKIRELIQLQSMVVGETHSDYAGGLAMLAELLIAKEELDDAEILLQRVLEIRKQTVGVDHVDYASTLDLLGHLHVRWGDLGAAEPFLEKALEARRNALGVDHPDVADTLITLADVLFRRDALDAAEGAFREALAIQKSAHGENHPKHADVLAALADVLVQKGALDDAEPMMRQVVHVRKEHLGETHPDYVQGLSSLASVLHLKGDLAEAEGQLRLVLDMRRQSLGQNHTECANIITQLGLLRQRLGDFRGAEELLRNAVEVRKQALGDRHPEHATGLNRLAQVLQKLGDLQGAEPLLRQALVIRKDVLGNRHPEYAASLMSLAQLIQKRGDLIWARMLIKEASEVRLAIHGEMHADYAQCLAALADVMIQQGEVTTGPQLLLNRALEIRSQVLGDKHPAVAASLSSLGALMRRQNDFDAAEAYLLQALEVRRVSLGEYHPDFATNLGNLAWLHQRKGDIDSAVAYLTRALHIRTEIFGGDHPETLQNLERLQSLRADLPEYNPDHQPVPIAPGPQSCSALLQAQVSTSGGTANEQDSTSSLATNGSPREEHPSASQLGPHADAVMKIYDDYEHSLHDGNRIAEHRIAPSPPFEDQTHGDKADDSSADEKGEPAPNERFDPGPGNRLDDGTEELRGLIHSEIWPQRRPAHREPTFGGDPLIENPVGFDLSDLVNEDAQTDGFEPEDDDSIWEGSTEAEALGLSDEALFVEHVGRSSHVTDGDLPPPSEDEMTLPMSTRHDTLNGEGDSDRFDGIHPDRPDPAGGPVDGRAVEESVSAACSEGGFNGQQPSITNLQAVAESVRGGSDGRGVSQSGSPSMTESSSVVSQDLSTLSDRFSELGEQLLAAARQLHAPGLPPSDTLLDEIESCRRDFQGIRDRAIGLAEAVEVSPPPPDEMKALQDVQGLLDTIAEAETRRAKVEEVRRIALRAIDRALLVEHATSPDFAPIVQCHEAARSLRQSIEESGWASLPAEAEALAADDHPLCHLVALLDNTDDLDDDLWATHHESVGRHFGKPLAAAAARSKLVLRDGPDGGPNRVEMVHAEGE